MNDTTYDWPGDGAQDTENAQHVREPSVLGASANERVAVRAILPGITRQGCVPPVPGGSLQMSSQMVGFMLIHSTSKALKC